MSARGIAGSDAKKICDCSSCHFLTPQDLSCRRWRFDNNSQSFLPHVSEVQQMAVVLLPPGQRVLSPFQTHGISTSEGQANPLMLMCFNSRYQDG